MDSANILSILASLGGNQDPSGGAPAPAPAPDASAPATNVMQAAAAPPQAPSPQFQDPTAPQVAQAATDASPPMPKPKRSLLDTIGRISDVLATVGGAQALYQPTLDAATARANAADDHARQVAKDNLDLATGKFDLSDKQRTAADDERGRFASVLDAVNDDEDAAHLPAMMAAAGLTDPRYAPFVKMIQADPSQAKILSGALGGGDAGANVSQSAQVQTYNMLLQVDPTGKLAAKYANGLADPSQVVNLGDRTILLGKNTGDKKTILPNGVKPDTVANNRQSNTNNVRTTSTQLTIAGMPARAQPGKAGANPTATAQDALTALDNIQHGFDRLHSMQALPGEGGALNQVESAIGRTGIGQKVGAQFNAPAAQERLAMQKNLKNLQSYMISSLPGSATRTRFEQEIQNMRLPDPTQMNYATASRVIQELRSSYQRALAASAKETAAAPKAGGGNLPTYTPEQVRALKLPSGTRFLGTDGQERFVH